jgi:KaiC/GvpD/RAD55 family RecA-like ATPase
MDSAETDVSLDELQAFFNAKYPDANTEVYQGLFNDINAAEIGEAVGHKILSEIKQREGLRKLSELAFAATQGRATLQDVLSATEAVKAENPQGPSNEEAFVTTDLEEIVNGTIATNGIRWRLNCLNASLGSLRKGDFGFTFARPETGKTTFVADLAANAFNQVSDPVVWFNNEEVGSKVMLRVYQSYFGVDLQTLMGKAAYFKAEFQRRVGRKFLLLDNATIDKTTIEKVLAREKPSLIIYDQIDKIKGFKADRDDLVYGAIYQWARELAKTYAPSIGVCQADGTAEGQKWLTMANVANAKTSKQAEADWILGIGKTHNQAEEYVRYLNISKNKLTGDVDSDPAQRHGHFEVIIQPTIARYKDVRNDWTKK